MRRLFFIMTLLPLCGGRIDVQSIYTHVQQDGVRLSQLGTAAFDVSRDSHPTVEFIDGKAVMTIAGNTVATLPMSNGGELVVAHETDVEASQLNRVTKAPSEKMPFATIFSPFQLTIPSGCEVFAPAFDANSMQLYLGAEQMVEAGQTVPSETALTIHGTSPVKFIISSGAPTCTPASALRMTPHRAATDTAARWPLILNALAFLRQSS